MSNDELDLGWCQGYFALKYHLEDALIESNLNPEDAVVAPEFAIFSHKYYDELNKLDSDKTYDYCFIGSLKTCWERRKWVVDFARKFFTSKSIFINTDYDSTWKLLGDYDFSDRKLGYNPKHRVDSQSRNAQYRVIQENTFYFQTMKQSKYVLCPGGDAPWSFRFYEILMCKSIPIVESWHHTYRTKQEASIPYNYILSNNKLFQEVTNTLYNKDMIEMNTELFLKYHMINKK